LHKDARLSLDCARDAAGRNRRARISFDFAQDRLWLRNEGLLGMTSKMHHYRLPDPFDRWPRST